jgi:hypothetical protein
MKAKAAITNATAGKGSAAIGIERAELGASLIEDAPTMSKHNTPPIAARTQLTILATLSLLVMV